jgi:RimJ/RimL family protein N-acetyltransferase
MAAGDFEAGLQVGARVSAQAALLPSRTVLAGRDVRVTPLDPAVHSDALFAAAGGREHEALWVYMHHGPFEDRRAFDAYMADRAAREDPFSFAIVDAASGRACGLAALMRIDPPNRVIEVGSILYSAALQKTRGATEAMYLLARYVFEELGYRRYEWKCHALNAPSRAAALRLGFSFEGIFRQHMIVKGRSRDTAWYSMLDTEWPVRKAALERWLAPDNFDANGRQRTRLSGPPASLLTP